MTSRLAAPACSPCRSGSALFRAPLFALAAALLAVAAFLPSSGVHAASEEGSVEFAFPPPDLGPEYVYPQSFQTPPRMGWLSVVDVAVLVVALGLAAAIALRWRSRRGMFWLTIFSLLYFGFYRQGCVCPIGAIQNVSLAFTDTTYILPWTVLAFFLLPLLFALFFGRVFCAGVCPLGALQEVALVKAHRVPRSLDEALGLLRYVYLGLAILFTLGGASFLICKYDPLIAFFRLGGRFQILIWSGAVLALATVIGRPYCRYLCPYGAMLGLLSRFAMRRTSITPAECVNCGLCSDACPSGAVREADEPEGSAS